MKRSFPQIYENLQVNIFAVTYVLSVIFIFYLLTVFIHLQAVEWWVLIAVFYLVIFVVLWAHLYALFTIPRRLSGEFDNIKNDISTGRIRDCKTFASRLSDFLIKFYSFSFFDIEHAVVSVKGKELFFSSEEIKNSLQWESLIPETQKSPDQIKHGMRKVNGSQYFLYTVPIWFGNEWLGYFTIFTRRRPGVFMLKLLSELEENFIDDQLKHIINIHNY